MLSTWERVIIKKERDRERERETGRERGREGKRNIKMHMMKKGW